MTHSLFPWRAVDDKRPTLLPIQKSTRYFLVRKETLIACLLANAVAVIALLWFVVGGK